MSGFDHQNQAIVIRKKTITIDKPLMQLKDYLLDDLSSCSSNGFKSFPRKRQCCTTVRFLLEIDLKQKNHVRTDGGRVLRRSRSKTASERLSALLRASDAVINAVKHLPYRRLFMSRFWGRSDSGCKGRKRLDHRGPSDRSTESAMTGGESWWERNFQSFSEENDMSFQEADGGHTKMDKATVGDDSNSSTEAETTTVKEWSNEEEKEQFSPVSILDCPFEDDDNEDQITSSRNSNHKLISLEGTKQKIRRFANIEPVDLQKRIAMSELEYDNELSTTVSIRKDEDFDDNINESEETARVLVKLVKGKNNYLRAKADSLMLDFFKERLIEDGDESKVSNVKDALKVMENWLSNGDERELWLGWEVKEGRNCYVNYMEKGGKWKRFDVEKEEVCFDLEASIWESLVNELFIV